MAGNRLQVFFGDDLEETWDSLRSVPGAFGNIVVGVIRQVRAVDAAAFVIVAAGLAWFVGGHAILEERTFGFYALTLVPLLLWLAAGIVGGLVFHVGAIGKGAFRYWESYVLMVFFAMFGVLSLRLALDPRDRRVYRASPAAHDA